MSRILIPLMTGLLLTACTQQPTATGPETASLLLRHDALGSSAEVEQVMTRYDNLTARLATHPQDADAAMRLAALFQTEARITGEHGHYFPAAADLLEAVLQNDETTQDQRFQALSLYATVLASQHDFNAALTHVEEAIAINPYNAAVRGVQVDALVELGRLDEAVEACDAMMAIRPDLRSYSRVSYLRELHGDHEGAAQAMDLAVSAGLPGSEERAWCRTQLSALYRDMDRPQAGEEQLLLALAERPNYPFAMAAQARLFRDRGDDAAAETALNEALAIIPEVGFAEDLLAIYQDQGRTQEANALTEEILVMYADDIATGHQMDWDLAQFLAAHTDQQQRALELGRQALAKRPANTSIRAFVQSLENGPTAMVDR